MSETTPRPQASENVEAFFRDLTATIDREMPVVWELLRDPETHDETIEVLKRGILWAIEKNKDRRAEEAPPAA